MNSCFQGKEDLLMSHPVASSSPGGHLPVVPNTPMNSCDCLMALSSRRAEFSHPPTALRSGVADGADAPGTAIQKCFIPVIKRKIKTTM